MDGLEFRVLGTLEVLCDGEPVRIAAARQRDVLTALLLHANRVVATDQLIKMVWGDDPPATALNTLHTLVRRLRQRLDDTPAGAKQLLQTQPPGYRLTVEPGRLDLSRFEVLRRRGREALSDGDPATATRLLGEAVALWRGPALADVTAHWLLLVEQPRLQEQYLQAVEERIDAELAEGRHAEMLGELRRLVAEQPLRERPYGQLMTALYRSGRQAEALETYRRLRQTLTGELGVEPEPGLQQLHRAVLRGDPTLELSGPGADTGGTPTVAEPPAQLPASVSSFTGRTDELAQLDKVTASASDGSTPVAVVVGTAGVGKTALAVHWAQRFRDRYPDGQLYIDLQGYAPVPSLPAIDAVGRFLRALGVPPERVPADLQEAAGLYRTLLARRRMLVMLDNAGTPDQVRPLLPGSPSCLALVTSRDRLDGLVARDGAYRLTLDVLAPREAETLLRRTIDVDILAGEPDDLAKLARLCAYLPLALRIAAANLAGRRLGVTAYARQLRTGGALAGLSVTGDEQAAVRSAFALSYTGLPEDAQALFRVLGVFPGTRLAVAPAAALADIDVPQASRLLEELAAAHLVDESTPGRYRCHDLLRHYAAELAEHWSEAERSAAVARLCEWYMANVDRAARSLYPEMIRLPRAAEEDAPQSPEWTDSAEALDWLDEERSNLVRIVQHAAARGPYRFAYQIADGLRGYFLIRRHVTDCESICCAGAGAAAADQDRRGSAASQLGLAECYRHQHRYPEAIDHSRRAAQLAEQAGWPEGQAAALNHLGTMHGEIGSLGTEVEHITRALEIYQRIGHGEGQAGCLGNLGVACLELGRLEEAADHLTRALALDREQGSRLGQAYTLNGLGEVYLELERLDCARSRLAEGLALFREIGSPIGECQALSLLAEVHWRTGDYQRAGELARAAVAVVQDAGDGDGDADTRWSQAIAWNALATAHLGRGQPQAAIAEHQRALQAVRDGGNPYPEAETLLRLATASLALGRPDLASAHASQALTIARDRGYRRLEERAVVVLARSSTGDPT